MQPGRKSEGEVSIMLDTQQLTALITCDPEIVSGTPVFAGTRVPIKNLFDYLKGGHDLQEFFEDFPSVSEEQARRVIELAKDSLLAQFASE
jgi:uncharacterized protein (DUF433 family)